LEQPIELFIAITAIVVGLSHIVRPDDWAAAYRRLHGAGRAGAFANGGLSLMPGAIILAGHRVWTFPGVVITAFGCLLVLKGAVCLLAPDKALRSMEHGANSPKSFQVAGAIVLVVGVWAAWCALRVAG
jgi:uncharacterized protein YjeT (DUF2065 family)